MCPRYMGLVAPPEVPRGTRLPPHEVPGEGWGAGLWRELWAQSCAGVLEAEQGLVLSQCRCPVSPKAQRICPPAVPGAALSLSLSLWGRGLVPRAVPGARCACPSRALPRQVHGSSARSSSPLAGAAWRVVAPSPAQLQRVAVEEGTGPAPAPSPLPARGCGIMALAPYVPCPPGPAVPLPKSTCAYRCGGTEGQMLP